MELSCRTCLKKSDFSDDKDMEPLYQMTPVSTCDMEVQNRLKLEQLLGFKIKLEKLWPNRICRSCLKSLNAAHDFRTMCIENQEKLSNIKMEVIEAEAFVPEDSFDETNEAPSSIESIIVTPDCEPIEYADKELPFKTKHKGRKRKTKDVCTNINKRNKKLRKSTRIEIKKDPLTEDENCADLEDSQKYEDHNCSEENRKSKGKRVISTKRPELKICDMCGLKCRNDSYLTMHMRRHLHIKPFQCEICEKSFVSNQELRRHMRVHTGDRPYTCKFCDRKFGDLSTIQRHERTHTNERPFVCKCCGRGFSRSQLLKEHMVTHTGEKHFKCTPCNKTFATRKLLMQHNGTLRHKQVANECNPKMETDE